MLEMLSPGRSLTWDLFWQSSVFLAVGLMASLAIRGRPARAHRVLVLTMIAALCTPLLAQAIRHGEWGLLKQSTPIAVNVEPAISSERNTTPAELVRVSQALPDFGKAQLPFGEGRPDAPRSLPEDRSASFAGSGSLDLKLTWRPLLLALWILFSGLAIVRFVASFVRGLRLVRGSVSSVDLGLNVAISRALSRLGLVATPDLRTSPGVRCPSVWCWGRQPIVLVPDRVHQQDNTIDWVAIFCHELAHWRRFDHVASLAGELLVCALPWNPLAWWARTRLGQLAELACDDWVLACGSEGTDYAASLLELVPQRGPAFALSAVSSRGGLVGRVRHILDERRSSPRIGKSWACFTGASMTLAVSAIALAQARPVSPGPRQLAVQASNAAPAVDAESKKANTLIHTVRGQVVGPDGKPARDATVVWVGTRKPSVPYVALPRDDETGRNPQVSTLAKAQTDSRGDFTLTASFGPDELIRFNGIESKLVVIASGAGLFSKDLNKAEGEAAVSVQLPAETVIHGRLLTPAGQPASGARVSLDGFFNDLDHSGMGLGLQKDDDNLPPYWPRSRRTGADGRFTLEGVPRGSYASLSFWHPDYAVDEVTVNTREDGAISPVLKGFEITPVKPDFTHTLEPARPVQGRVTDKTTGKPLAGMLVEMIPMRSHGGMIFSARTDADGRYRISGHQTDGIYFTTVYPPADSGYLGSSDQHQGWPAGAGFLEVNFPLEKGQLVSGRVIDQISKQPVIGAAVVYQAAARNPNNTGNHDLRNTVLTDKEGRFKITALAGGGGLAVEAPDENYIRSAWSKFTSRTVYPHGQVAMDVPRDGTPVPVEIALRKGVTLEAKVVGPDGKIVKDVTAFYPGIDAKLIDIWNQGQEFPDGIFRIQGADPEKSYRVFFIKPDQRLGAVAELKYEPGRTEPIELKLQPTATIRGKVVNPGGAAAPGAQVTPFLAFSPEPKDLSSNEMHREQEVQFYTNFLGQRNFYFHNHDLGSQGDFTFESMVPGAWFYVSATSSGRVARTKTPVLKPGQVYDLGTLSLKEEQR